MTSSITKNQSEKKKKKKKKKKYFAIGCERNTQELVRVNHLPIHRLLTHGILVKQFYNKARI